MDIAVERYTGPHRDLDWSFRLAEDSRQVLDSYLDCGAVWVARSSAGQIVGHLQAVPRDDVWEVTNIAVVKSLRGQGVGRALLE